MTTVPEEPTHQPERCVTGNCPQCQRLLVVFNNHEAGPLVLCHCGWVGATDQVANYHRAERVHVEPVDHALLTDTVERLLRTGEVDPKVAAEAVIHLLVTFGLLPEPT